MLGSNFSEIIKVITDNREGIKELEKQLEQFHTEISNKLTSLKAEVEKVRSDMDSRFSDMTSQQLANQAMINDLAKTVKSQSKNPPVPTHPSSKDSGKESSNFGLGTCLPAVMLLVALLSRNWWLPFISTPTKKWFCF